VAPHLPLWLVRAGALLAVAAFFLPHVEPKAVSVPAVEGSPLEWVRGLSVSSFLNSVIIAWLAAPLILSPFLFASSFSASRTNPRIRGACVGLFLLAAFAMSVYGSIQATSVQGASSSFSPIVFFLAPLLLAGGILARVLAGAEGGATAALARASLGALLALNAWCEAEIFGPLSVRFLPGLYVAAAAGLLVAAGETILLVRGEPLPPPATASP
jgi:hypothetical protein